MDVASRSQESQVRFVEASWLQEVPASIRVVIWRFLRERSEPVGHRLLDEHGASDHLWFVLDGSVVAERTRPGPQGRAETLAELSGSAIYGATTFFRNSAPTLTIRATSPIRGWTLDRASYQQLRSENLAAAEAHAQAVVKVLAERFDMLDRRLTELMAEHQGDRRRASEWADFRSRLFEEPAT